MSDQQDLLDLLDEIKAVADKNVKKCDMPLEIYLYEAERLHTRATTDLPQLATINMPSDLVDKLLTRTKALRRAQLNWAELVNEKKKARDTWKAEAPAILQLRKDLIENMQFAYRNNPLLLEKLAKIKKGNSHADTTMDLARLAVLGKDNPEPLKAINFDLSLCDKAAEEAERMGNLRANIGGRMYVPDDMLIIRNKAFTLLKEVVDEIRSYGKFVFRGNSELLKGYKSQYRRENNAEYWKSKKSKITTPKMNSSDHLEE